MALSKMGKTLKYFTAAIIMGLLLPGLALSAVLTETGALNPDWTPWPANVTGGVVEFETRLGNLGLNGDWELGHKFDGAYLDTSGQFAIGNGVDFDFTLTHDSGTGEFTLSLAGGPSTTWDSGRPGEALQEIWFLAKTSNGAYTSTVKNLNLDGSPINDLVAVNNKIYLKIYGEQFSDFLLQGTMNFSWSSGSPSGSHIEALASVVFEELTASLVLLDGAQEYYGFIQDAYDAIALGSTETMKVQALEFPESLILDQDVTVTLKGGYDEFFSEPSSGWTTIAFAGVPAMLISNGTVIAEYIILR